MPAPLPALPQPADPRGSFLFSDDQMEKITDEEKRLRLYRTADRVPEPIRKSIIKLLKDSWTKEDIADVLHVAHQTVTVIENHPDHAQEIEQHRSALVGAKSLRAIQKQLDRLNKHPDLLPYQAIGFTVRALYDIHALEAGKPTERSEHTERVDIFARYQAMILELKKEMTGENTGLHAGELSPLFQPAGAPGATDPGLTAGSVAPADADLESDRAGHAPQVEPGHVTCFDTAAGGDPGRAAPADRGDRTLIQTPGHPPGGGSAPGETTGSPNGKPQTEFFSH